MSAKTATVPKVNKKLIPVTKPDKDAFDATLATLNVEIKELQKKMDVEEAKIKKLFDGTKGTRAKRSTERDTSMLIRAERKKLMDQRKQIYDARDAFQTTLANMRDASKKMRNTIKYRNVEDIDKAIMRLERRQTTSSMSISDEKNLIKEVTLLKNSRKTLESFSKSMGDSDGTKTAVRGLNEQLSAVNIKLKEVNGRMDKQMKIVKGLETTLDAAHKDEVPILKKKKAVLKKQLDIKYTDLRKIRSEYYDQNKKFREYMKERNQQRWEQKKAEQAAYEKSKSDEIRKFEEEEEKKKPWMEEIATCDALISYLKGLKPKAKKTVEVKAVEAGPSTITMDDGSVLTLAPKKGADIDIGRKGKRGKKLRKKAKKPVSTVLSHAFDTFDDFKRIGMKAPVDQSDIDATLNELHKKRDYYDTKPRVMKVVSTPYGAGKVKQTRSDGIKVVVMDWTLANGAKVHAYMQSVDCKTKGKKSKK